MGAGPKREAAATTARGEAMHASGMRGLLAELSAEALRYVPGSRIEQTARQWLARSGLPEDDPRGLLAMADAIGFASDLALFSQAAICSGQAALGARQRWPKISRAAKRLRQRMISGLLFPSATRRRT